MVFNMWEINITLFRFKDSITIKFVFLDTIRDREEFVGRVYMLISIYYILCTA